jgi:hypothetical protein
MKTKNQKLILFVILFISFFSFAQKKNQVSKTPTVNNEIQNMVKLIFDAPDLVKYYKDPKNLPVKILEYDEINKINFENYKIYGQNIQIITMNDVNKNNISDYIDIVKWNEVLNMLDFELLHNKSKIRYKVLLIKKGGSLKLGSSEIIKTKK